MSSPSENNKRIAKNTIALYFRQIITMVVALFTSRIVLQTLGVTDYGINNVVGGVVMMFGFISGTLMSITQRFISVELGKGGDIAVLRKIFSTSMILHIAACVIVLILAETAGLWFLNNKLVIPAERMIAANWVYQFAVFGFVLSMLNAPLTALIISHEDMHVYGYMGIFDVVVRLLTVYLLVIINADKLIFLALFGFAVTCIVWFFYFIYCRRKYQYARFSLVYDNSLLKELGGYGGYTFLGIVFGILSTQGVNMMLNIFFGPAINAARGIALAVGNAVLSFGNNFRQAITPQLMKFYTEDQKQMWILSERGTRMLFFLVFIFSVPFLLKTEFILKLWLGSVPEYAAIFTKLLFIDAMLGPLPYTSNIIINATGNIKAQQLICGCAPAMIILILSYLVCKAGYAPQYVFIVPLLVRLPTIAAAFILIKKQTNFLMSLFIKKALVPIFVVSVISFLPFYFVNKLFSDLLFHHCIIIVTSMLWTGIVIMFIGMRKNERVEVLAFVKRRISLKQIKTIVFSK